MLSLIILKPDCLRRKLVGRLLSPLEKLFNIRELQQVTLTEEQARKLYHKHLGEDWFEHLVEHTTSGQSVIICVEGKLEDIKNMVTDLRIDFAIDQYQNTIYSSDSAEAANSELEIFWGQKWKENLGD